MTVKETRDIKRKLNVINYAKKIGNVTRIRALKVCNKHNQNNAID